MRSDLQILSSAVNQKTSVLFTLSDFPDMVDAKKNIRRNSLKRNV